MACFAENNQTVYFIIFSMSPEIELYNCVKRKNVKEFQRVSETHEVSLNLHVFSKSYLAHAMDEKAHDIVKYLLQQGVACDRVDHMYTSALFYAARSEDTVSVAMILKTHPLETLTNYQTIHVRYACPLCNEVIEKHEKRLQSATLMSLTHVVNSEEIAHL